MLLRKILIVVLVIFLVLVFFILALLYLLRPLISYLTRPANLKEAKILGDELLKSQGKTFVVVVAHPDDAEWYAGGTLARLAENNRVVLVDGTSGEKGANVPNLGKIREEKERRAGQVVGYAQIVFLRFPDRGLRNNQEFRSKLSAIFQKEEPEAVFTFDAEKPSYIYRHPDHQAAGAAAREVSRGFPAIKSLYLFHSRENNTIVEFTPVREKKDRALMLLTDYGSRNAWIGILSFLFRPLQRREETYGRYGVAERYPEIGVKFGELFRKIEPRLTE